MKFKGANLAVTKLTALGMIAGVASACEAEKNIVETAVAAGNFKTLAAALRAASLVNTVAGPGPFAVFAPTDAAFAKLPAGTVENQLKPENKEQPTAILTYHAVPGKVMAADVVKLSEAMTVNGGNVIINDAKVTSTNIPASMASFT